VKTSGLFDAYSSRFLEKGFFLQARANITPSLDVVIDGGRDRFL